MYSAQALCLYDGTALSNLVVYCVCSIFWTTYSRRNAVSINAIPDVLPYWCCHMRTFFSIHVCSLYMYAWPVFCFGNIVLYILFWKHSIVHSFLIWHCRRIVFLVIIPGNYSHIIYKKKIQSIYSSFAAISLNAVGK